MRSDTMPLRIRSKPPNATRTELFVSCMTPLPEAAFSFKHSAPSAPIIAIDGKVMGYSSPRVNDRRAANIGERRSYASNRAYSDPSTQDAQSSVLDVNS